ncbi:MAG TPA: CDP-diacylglycerol--glycerol-3-phosphate 3-phosphatidyltransferase [Thermoanaerobaculia bacterium]|nr:CDP-diacylglycerol--glycerol-3-phosphate 3-phosphatidyltransferase [Thermoanaerobaculia bacterium]HSN86513.1 CDP-diacylglycerol--glycerol-3-phosphate 3-phosphatidyltransferase [Thermoanaerobaculia bacterium]
MINIPNLLSIFRILLVPPLVVVLLTKFEGKEWWGLGLFLLAALMDFLDGFLARKRKEVTRLGTLLDPAADKILISAAFISLVELDHTVVPAWMVVVIIAREFAVTSLRSFAAAENLVIPAGLSGKIKTTVQIISISLLIIYSQLGEFRHLAPISLWVAVAITAYSGVEYFVRFGKVILRGGFGDDPPKRS